MNEAESLLNGLLFLSDKKYIMKVDSHRAKLAVVLKNQSGG